MNNAEKAERCKHAQTDNKDRCKVYARWIGHDGYDGCADCSFATISRKNGKPIQRGKNPFVSGG